MPDNFIANPGAGGSTFAADEIGVVLYPRSKITLGADGIDAGDVSASNPMPVTGSIAVSNMVAQGLTDTQLRATPVPVSASALPLPTGAATETTLAALNTKMPAQGQALMAASHPVVIASNQSAVPTVENATVLTGQAAQTAVINNILEAVAGVSGTDVSNLRAAAVQVVSTGTAGTFIFEQSNDNVNWVALPVFNAALVTGVPITAAITASASAIIYSFPIRCRFIRLRIATLITGGSIQAFSRLSSEPWTAAAQLVASNTAANLAATVSGTVTANIGTGSIAAGTNLAMDVGVQVRATTNGTTVTNILSAATNNLTQLKGTAGKIAGGFLTNTTASLQYLKLFNVPSASVTMGTTAATTQVALQPNQTVNLSQGDLGTFIGGTGVTIAITTGSALADNTATTAGSVVGFIAWV